MHGRAASDCVGAISLVSYPRLQRVTRGLFACYYTDLLVRRSFAPTVSCKQLKNDRKKVKGIDGSRTRPKGALASYGLPNRGLRKSSVIQSCRDVK